MDKDIAIKVENLSKVYKLYNAPIDRLKEALSIRGKKYHKDFYALNDVSFEIKKGETVGIVGRNGSGKSTLLKIITGVLSPTYGKVTVNGRVSALLELGAGFNPEYTGIENIYFQGSLMGYEQEEMDSKLNEILEFADIGDFIHQPVKMYSSGMFARLAFAVAINVEPDILIVDEALSVGDMFFQEKCLRTIRQKRECGNMAVVFVSHSLPSVRNFCDKATWLMNGELYLTDSSIVVTQEYERFFENEIQNKLPYKTQVDSEYHSKIDFNNSKYNAMIRRATLNYSLIKSDDDLILSLSIMSKDTSLKLGVGIILYSSERKIISLFNILRDGYYLSDNDNYELILNIPHCDLLKGKYFLSLSLVDDLGMVAYDIQDFCLQFEVEHKINQYNGLPISEGIVRLKHNWISTGLFSENTHV